MPPSIHTILPLYKHKNSDIRIIYHLLSLGHAEIKTYSRGGEIQEWEGSNISYAPHPPPIEYWISILKNWCVYYKFGKYSPLLANAGTVTTTSVPALVFLSVSFVLLSASVVVSINCTAAVHSTTGSCEVYCLLEYRRHLSHLRHLLTVAQSSFSLTMMHHICN